jgi:hypothetical protein
MSQKNYRAIPDKFRDTNRDRARRQAGEIFFGEFSRTISG